MTDFVPEVTEDHIKILDAFWQHAEFDAKNATEYDKADNALRAALRRARAGLSDAGQLLNDACDLVHDVLKAQGKSVLVVCGYRRHGPVQMLMYTSSLDTWPARSRSTTMSRQVVFTPTCSIASS